MGKVKFEVVLKEAASLPAIRVNRENFLRAELKKYCQDSIIDKAIETSPSVAGISPVLIDTIAKHCINFETNKVSAISFATGLPGGITMLGTIPADVIQYFGHVLRILQKLAYLYDWENLFNEDGNIDDETMNLLTVFFGVMFGVNGASAALTKIAGKASERVYKVLVSKALTKGTIYPIVKKIATNIGVKMTKDVFAKGVSKTLPVIGGVASGTLTYATYKPMAKRLQKYLRQLNQERDKKYE